MDKQQEQSLFSTEEYKATFKKNKKGNSEENLQLAVCEYLRNTYPDVIWMCDLASGMKLPIFIAARNAKMRSSRGLPDLFVAKPVLCKRNSDHIMEGPYNGLFMELKKEGTRLKNGNMPKSDHMDEQAVILARLKQLGFRAEFACGYTEAIKLIDEYLKG